MLIYLFSIVCCLLLADGYCRLCLIVVCLLMAVDVYFSAFYCYCSCYSWLSLVLVCWLI